MDFDAERRAVMTYLFTAAVRGKRGVVLVPNVGEGFRYRKFWVSPGAPDDILVAQVERGFVRTEEQAYSQELSQNATIYTYTPIQEFIDEVTFTEDSPFSLWFQPFVLGNLAEGSIYRTKTLKVLVDAQKLKETFPEAYEEAVLMSQLSQR